MNCACPKTKVHCLSETERRSGRGDVEEKEEEVFYYEAIPASNRKRRLQAVSMVVVDVYWSASSRDFGT